MSLVSEVTHSLSMHFLWSFPFPLKKTDTLQMITHLHKYRSTQFTYIILSGFHLVYRQVIKVIWTIVSCMRGFVVCSRSNLNSSSFVRMISSLIIVLLFKVRSVMNCVCWKNANWWIEARGILAFLFFFLQLSF